MDRRAFLGSAAALSLPGCATTALSPVARAHCLAPVIVGPDRVIRAVAGLRPYRAAGFVVRQEGLAGKRLVHNYGHGGAGITLSWGTARLAVDLGRIGHSGPVAVIGAGIAGLTTARLAQEAGFDVTVYAEALPPHTTSNVAGGQWQPLAHYREAEVSAEWRAQYAAALDYSWRRFQILVGDDYGVRWVPTYMESQRDPAAIHDRYRIGIRDLGPGEHPFPADRVIRFDTMYVETGRFLRQLLRDVQIARGRIAVRRFETPADISGLSENLVFNCTGLGARALFGDEGLEPVRGQLAILRPQPEVDYAFAGPAGYMFPRPDGIVIGGTFERGEWDATPQPEAIARIVASHRRLFGAMRCTA